MVTSPQIASTAILSAWRSGMTSPFGKFLRWAMMSTRIIRERPSSRAGMMPAMNRWATEIVPPAAIE